MQIQLRTDRQRRAAVARWRRSGLPAHEFAPLAGVAAATLYSWSRRFPPDTGAAGRPVAADGPHASAAVVELVPVSDSSRHAAAGHDVHVSLRLRSGRVLRFASGLRDEDLRRLVAVAESA